MLSRDTEIGLFTVSLHSLPSVVPAKSLILILIYFSFQKLQYFSQSCCVWEIHCHVNVHEFYEKEIEVRVMEQCGLVAILLHHANHSSCLHTSWQHEKWMIGILQTWSDFLLWIFALKIWSRSFTIVICLLTEPVLISFF